MTSQWGFQNTESQTFWASHCRNWRWWWWLWWAFIKQKWNWHWLSST